MLSLTGSKWKSIRPRKISQSFLLLMACMFFASVVEAASPLVDHPSPYLRLHTNDAVKWQVWDQAVIDQARKQNKLIFISIGYYACHWCHVMREESFDNDRVAEVINQHFIPVKVDRELNPALDDYLMNFVQLTRGHGGWPLNVFLTPQGYPMVGLVYLPQKDFLALINKLQNDWVSNQDELNMLASNAFDFSRDMLFQSQPMPSAKQLEQSFKENFHSNADMLLGGMGDQAKFPQPALLMALLLLYEKNKDAELKDFIVLTLDQIATKGLHDVIGGGFYRYVIDPSWHVPHFEKMLHTNAGLASVYVKAYELLKDQKYLDIAIETVEFMQREMWLGQGFASSLSAQDTAGVEGGSYTWSMDELRQQLTDKEWQAISDSWTFFDVEETGGKLPVGLATDPDWQVIKQKLYQKRVKNPSPMDEKILLSWNGYALSAIAGVVKVSGLSEFKVLGKQLFNQLKQHAESGMARKAKGVERHYLEDYAYLIQGMLDWLALSNDRSFDQQARQLTLKAINLFAVEQGWRLSDEGILPMPGDQVAIPDAQLPSSQIVLLNLVHRLGMQNDKTIKKLMLRQQQQADTRMLQNSLGFASHVTYQLQHSAN